MKKLFMFFVVMLMLMSVTGCSKPKGDPGIIGYVMKTDTTGRILVIDSKPQDFSSTGGDNEFYNAIWFSNVPSEIAIGQKVKVWFDIVLESYPAQSEVEYIEVIPAQKPDGAKRNEAEVLKKAISSSGFKDIYIAVKSIQFIKEASVWRIELQELWEDKTHSIEIKDN